METNSSSSSPNRNLVCLFAFPIFLPILTLTQQQKKLTAMLYVKRARCCEERRFSKKKSINLLITRSSSNLSHETMITPLPIASSYPPVPKQKQNTTPSPHPSSAMKAQTKTLNCRGERGRRNRDGNPCLSSAVSKRESQLLLVEERKG